MAKQYGLIVPGKTAKTVPTFEAAKNVFGDSDSDDGKPDKEGILLPSANVKRQAKKDQEKALVEDPTVYQYDELYDDMTNKKEEVKILSKKDKRPRYIEKLMESANKRKRDNERRIERQVQKEREKEGDEFADKETFVTTAYKKKLEEMRLEEEKEKREAYLESIGDVTKQKDLGGFYRHLYEQKLGTDSDTKVKTEEKSDKKEDAVTENPEAKKKVKKEKKNRNYRKRKTSVELAAAAAYSLSEGEIISDEEINRINLESIRAAKKLKENDPNIDADSDFSIDSSSEDEDNKENPKEIVLDKAADAKDLKDTSNLDENKEIKDEQKEVSGTVDKKENEVEEKPKIDIWKKRTVGVVFEQALQRYYERKATRGH